MLPCFLFGGREQVFARVAAGDPWQSLTQRGSRRAVKDCFAPSGLAKTEGASGALLLAACSLKPLQRDVAVLLVRRPRAGLCEGRRRRPVAIFDAAGQPTGRQRLLRPFRARKDRRRLGRLVACCLQPEAPTGGCCRASCSAAAPPCSPTAPAPGRASSACP